MPRAQVITGAVIIEDDDGFQFFYNPKCPKCEKVFTDQKGAGVAYFGSVYKDQGYCPSCKLAFDIKVTRD